MCDIPVMAALPGALQVMSMPLGSSKRKERERLLFLGDYYFFHGSRFLVFILTDFGRKEKINK